MRATGIPVIIFMAVFAPANASGGMDHSAHRAMMDKSQIRSIETYTLPPVSLVNQDGVEMALSGFLDSNKFVVVDFIFTTCTTICPVLSAGLVNFHKRLGEEAENVKFISISIDPEHDKSDVLKAYSRKYNMKPEHILLTGSRQDINAVMNAFDAVIPNKMTHYPLTFFRAPASQEWVRVSGMMSVTDLMNEYENMKKR